ncbi:hypothetical protein PR048_010322, partial [Dryococelus australis]
MGFRTPVTDACLIYISLCTFHSRRHILKEEPPGIIKFLFDCQKNLVSPKVPDQIVHYSSQLNTNNCTIVQVKLFTWKEHEYKKVSNKIQSAGYMLVGFGEDRGGGQNRNFAMITVTYCFLYQVAPGNVKSMELIFPFRWHFFDLQTGFLIQVIYNPTQYQKVFQKFGKGVQLGEDFDVTNWKEYTRQNSKLPARWHFKFASAKI